jgi:hypothetical protein
MTKSKSDPITDQEIAFAHLILSGTMTDGRAAEAVGLNPETAAYTKAKPRVRDYMLEHRAAAKQQLAQQEAVDGLHRLTPDREQVLARLWHLAGLGPEITRGSITGQVKALSIIVAMENFIPDPRAITAEKKSAPAPTAQIYQSAWLREKQATTHATTNDPQPSPAPPVPACGVQKEDLQEDLPAVPEPPDPAPNHATFANHFTPSQVPEPYVPLFPPVTGTRVGFSIRKNPFGRRPR